MQPKGRIKIICLNTWAGMAGMDLLDAFIRDHRDTDVFCLQEVWNGGTEMTTKTAAGRTLERVNTNLLNDLKETLPDHEAFFTPQFISYLGVAIFTRKSLHILDKGEVCVYREPGYISSNDIADHGRMLQYVTIETTDGPMTILNVHAAWQPVGKVDTAERLEQSQRIIQLTDSISHPLVLCGDFNLLPDTQSIRLLEEAGLKNLIRTHGITSTRTSFYTKPERFADYVFTKNNVLVHEFRVLPDEVSDHAPLFLECSVA